MGATNCPETPRQRMIGMMYLVLTAMLALNVSKDILNAFAVVDETLVTSTSITNQGNSNFQKRLALEKASQGEEKVKQAEKMVNQIVRESDELVKFIEQLKSDLLIYVDGTDKTKEGKLKQAMDISQKDNKSKVTQFMFGDDKTGSNNKATELKTKIEKYRNSLLSLIPADKTQEKTHYSTQIGLDVNKTFLNNDKAQETWQNHYFYNQIMIAAFTLLNKTIGEVRNAQSIMLNYAIGSTTADDFKFNKIDAKAIPVSQMVFSGDKYSAGVIVAAYDDRQTPEVYYKMGVDTLTSEAGAIRLDGKDGLVTLEIPAGNPGDQKYAGFIKVTKPNGGIAYYHFKDKYTVLKPSATVAAEKMNVFYAGIPNPVSVNAPVAPEKISIELVGGGSQIKTAPGAFNITVPENMAGREVTVNVKADLGGKVTPMGSTKFRVKRVPDPVVKVGGNYTGGKVAKGDLAANPFLSATMSQDFAYDLRWSITSYQVTFIVRGMEEAPLTIQGGTFSEALKTKIRNATPGTIIFFQGIRATSPAGSRTLPDIGIRIR